MARYPPDVWNLHDRILRDDPRTSNGIESWHNQLASCVGASHPTVWRLIEDIKGEVTLAEQRVDRYNSTGKAPRRNETYSKRDVNYKNRLENYGKINDIDFLKSIARNIVTNKCMMAGNGRIEASEFESEL